jgi:hypothetical protein
VQEALKNEGVSDAHKAACLAEVGLRDAKEELNSLAESDDEDAKDDAEAAVKKATRRYEAAATQYKNLLNTEIDRIQAQEKAEAEAAEKAAKASAPVTTKSRDVVPQGQPATEDPVDHSAPSMHVDGYRKGGTLYLIGRPQRAKDVTLWEDFMEPFARQVAEEQAVPHFRMIKFDASAFVLTAILAAVRSGRTQLPRNLVFMGPLNAQLHGTFIETLETMYDEVVK